MVSHSTHRVEQNPWWSRCMVEYSQSKEESTVTQRMETSVWTPCWKSEWTLWTRFVKDLSQAIWGWIPRHRLCFKVIILGFWGQSSEALGVCPCLDSGNTHLVTLAHVLYLHTVVTTHSTSRWARCYLFRGAGTPLRGPHTSSSAVFSICLKSSARFPSCLLTWRPS